MGSMAKKVDGTRGVTILIIGVSTLSSLIIVAI